MQLFLDATGRRLRAQVEHELRDAVRSGRLRAGSRLPSSRTLATQLGVSRGVVVEAYAQLVAEGHFEPRTGAGTFVALAEAGQRAPRRRSLTLPPPRFELRSGVPDVSAFPRAAWQKATAHALRTLTTSELTATRAQGLPRLCDAVADHVARVRGGVVGSEQVLIAPGFAGGLMLLWRALKERGVVRVGIEDPSWKAHGETLRAAGLERVMLPVDERGLRTERLARAGIQAMVVTPAHHYPTGEVMAPERRSALLDWARRTGGLIVEDDYDAEYRYDRRPVAALQGRDAARVVYGATVSKALTPGLRIGWLVAPPSLMNALVAQARVTRAAPSVIEQAALAHLMESGQLERHVRRTRRLYRARRDALLAALSRHLPEVRVTGAAAGLHLVAWLPEHLDDAQVARAARDRGIAVHALHAQCALEAPRPPALLLGYAAATEATLARAVIELAAVIRSAGGAAPGAGSHVGGRRTR